MTYVAPRSVWRPSQHRNWFTRTFDPKVLQVIHMTGNSRMAAAPLGIAEGSGAYGEWKYAATNADAADGPSAHDYIARDGPYIEMLNPATQVGWSNGDLNSPQTQYPGVKYLADLRARGINANRGVYRETESVAYPGTFPVTAAQRETIAYLLAKDSITTGLPIIPGTTVLVHAWINWINRQNCPFPPTKRDALLKAVCDRGKVIKAALAAPEEDMGLPVRFDATADPATVLTAFGTAKLLPDPAIRVIDLEDRRFVNLADGADLGLVQTAVLSEDVPLGGSVRKAGTPLVVFNLSGRATAAFRANVAFTPLPAPPTTEPDCGPAVEAFRAKAAEAAANAVKGVTA